MPKIFNINNHNGNTSKECSEINIVTNSLNEEKASLHCGNDNSKLFKDFGKLKKIGVSATTDPMQSGSIINDISKPVNNNIINRYSNALRGCDQGMKDLFKDIIVLDEDGKAHPVPIIGANQEKAVAYILANNVRKDNSLVVDRPVLPLMAIHSSGLAPDMSRFTYHKAKFYVKDSMRSELKDKDTIFGVTRGIPIDVSYTMYIWSLYVEDMNQILEQIILKFSPQAYIKVQNVPWEVTVSLDSFANNINYEPGDKEVRVVKYQINFTTKTYIPQPIIRNKTVLKIKTDIHNSTNELDINQTYDRQET
jgi:hypothetical protein